MKQGEMIALGLAGVAVYMIWKARSGGQPAAGLRGTWEAVSEIFDSGGGAFSNGWRYFSDGTAIDPAGNYYKDGQLIWSKPTAGATGGW